MDSQGGPIFDAQVRISSNSGTPVEHVTQSSGIADFENMPCGAWNVIAAKEGFEAAVKTVQTSNAANVEVSLTLNPKMQVSSVDVTETLPPVEQSSTQKTEVRPAEVKGLPNNPATVSDTLCLLSPRRCCGSPDGELKPDGTGEQRAVPL